MLLLPSKVIPRGAQWLYELKFDGFRGLALKDGQRVRLLSRTKVRSATADRTHRWSALEVRVRTMNQPIGPVADRPLFITSTI
jgi:hypothetical protein